MRGPVPRHCLSFTDQIKKTSADNAGDGKFQARTLTYGDATHATRGIEEFMCVDEEDLNVSSGVEGITAELKQNGTDEDWECLEYVLNEEAGSSDKTFQGGWKRDCSREAASGVCWKNVGATRPAYSVRPGAEQQ